MNELASENHWENEAISATPLSNAFAVQVFGASSNGLAGTMPPAALERLLHETVCKAAAAWPSIRLDLVLFVKHLGSQVSDEMFVDGVLPALHQAEKILESRHAEDLYLACACCHRDDAAIKILDEQYLGHIGDAIRSINYTQSFIDEVRQLLREKLLFSHKDGEAQLLRYKGRGTLKKWLAVVAQRIALDLLRSEKQLADRDDLDRVLPSVRDPELDYLKDLYREPFTVALHEAFRELSSQDQLIVKLVLRGLSHEKIGSVYRMHQTTVSRKLAEIRDKVRKRTIRLLSERLKIGASEIQSVVRLILSQLDIHLSSLLEEDEEGS